MRSRRQEDKRNSKEHALAATILNYLLWCDIWQKKRWKWTFKFQLNPHIGIEWLVAQICNVANIYIYLCIYVKYTVLEICSQNVLRSQTKSNIDNTEDLLTPEHDSYPGPHDPERSTWLLDVKIDAVSYYYKVIKIVSNIYDCKKTEMIVFHWHYFENIASYLFVQLCSITWANIWLPVFKKKLTFSKDSSKANKRKEIPNRIQQPN